MWPDLALAVTTYLRAELAGARVVTRTPDNLETSLPLVRVRNGPGDDDTVTDRASVDVETFTARSAPGAAWPLAEAVRQAMHALAGRSVEGALVDSVRTASRPVDVDYDNPAVTRYVAAYTLTARQRPPI